jgi:hypothetical protein
MELEHAVVDLQTVVDNRESNPSVYDAWNNAFLDRFGADIETMAKYSTCVMIPEHGFLEHAKWMAYETFDSATLDSWPFTHVDWEAAAEEHKGEYDSVVVDGTTYYFGNFYPD